VVADGNAYDSRPPVPLPVPMPEPVAVALGNGLGAALRIDSPGVEGGSGSGTPAPNATPPWTALWLWLMLWDALGPGVAVAVLKEMLPRSRDPPRGDHSMGLSSSLVRNRSKAPGAPRRLELIALGVATLTGAKAPVQPPCVP